MHPSENLEMCILSANQKREQSPSEECANSISHGMGLIAAIIGAPFLIVNAAQHGDSSFVVGTIVFTATVILLYLASTLYHALPAGKAKQIFLTIDHQAILLLIAGTYTPFTLGVLRGAWGWTLFGLIWGLAITGLALRAIYKTLPPMLSTGLYLLMGWLIIIAIDPLVTRVPTKGLLWLFAGGLSYTIGVIFFATDSRLPYGHFIWHVFVITGTVCHYFTVLWYAA